jgi:hypothetical protein
MDIIRNYFDVGWPSDKDFQKKLKKQNFLVRTIIVNTVEAIALISALVTRDIRPLFWILVTFVAVRLIGAYYYRIKYPPSK